jgi:hypothetical protein
MAAPIMEKELRSVRGKISRSIKTLFISQPAPVRLQTLQTGQGENSLYSKIAQRAEGVAQVVEFPSCKCEALSSKTGTANFLLITQKSISA